MSEEIVSSLADCRKQTFIMCIHLLSCISILQDSKVNAVYASKTQCFNIQNFYFIIPISVPAVN